MNQNKYKKIPLKGYAVLNLYPVYVDSLYEGHEPLKIVGVRNDSVELEGDYSGGTHNIQQKCWFRISECHLVVKQCDQQLEAKGCQLPNVHCCGGEKIITKHEEYWKK